MEILELADQYNSDTNFIEAADFEVIYSILARSNSFEVYIAIDMVFFGNCLNSYSA